MLEHSWLFCPFLVMRGTVGERGVAENFQFINSNVFHSCWGVISLLPVPLCLPVCSQGLYSWNIYCFSWRLLPELWLSAHAWVILSSLKKYALIKYISMTYFPIWRSFQLKIFLGGIDFKRVHIIRDFMDFFSSLSIQHPSWNFMILLLRTAPNSRYIIS